MSNRKMETLYVDHLAVSAGPGCHIDACLMQAVQLALSEKRVVRFEHNDRVFWIRPDQVLAWVSEKCIELRCKDKA
jgi:hypothetical protein